MIKPRLISVALVLVLGEGLSIAQGAPQHVQTRHATSLPTCGPTAPVPGSSAQVDKYMKLAAQAYKRGDYQEDFRQVQRAATLGDWGAQRILGLMYLRGKGTKVNMNMAAACLSSAANQGDPNAKVQLAIMYALGISPFDLDYKHAFQLADEVAKAGQPVAFCKVGQAMANHIPPDLQGAVQFFDAGIARGEKQYCAEGRAQITKPSTGGGTVRSSGGVDCSSPPICAFGADPVMNETCGKSRAAWQAACGSR